MEYNHRISSAVLVAVEGCVSGAWPVFTASSQTFNRETVKKENVPSIGSVQFKTRLLIQMDEYSNP